jgi:hypothetical protein
MCFPLYLFQLAGLAVLIIGVVARYAYIAAMAAEGIVHGLSDDDGDGKWNAFDYVNNRVNADPVDYREAVKAALNTAQIVVSK